MRPSKTTQRDFRRQAGDATVIWIKPNNVLTHTGSKWPVSKARLAKYERVLPKAIVRALRPAAKKREPFLLPAAHFPASVPIKERALYLKIKDFVERAGDLEDTIWYQELADALAAKGTAAHKELVFRDQTKILEFFRGYVQPLIDSLRTDGFKPEATGFESSAIVDHEGRLSKSGSGNHRFAIAHVLDLDRFPLRIVAVHEAWYAREVAPHGDTLESLRDALRLVERRHGEAPCPTVGGKAGEF
ncbi:MAG: hypothetical protein MK098_10745 [Marinovum sp.]|nr:hypothetical protein [Marinovum sp.]